MGYKSVFTRCKGTKCAVPGSSALSYKTHLTIHPAAEIESSSLTVEPKVSNMTNNRFMITYKHNDGSDEEAYGKIYTYTPYTDDDDLGSITEGSEFKIDSNTGGAANGAIGSFSDGGYVLTWHQGGNILLEIFN